MDPEASCVDDRCVESCSCTCYFVHVLDHLHPLFSFLSQRSSVAVTPHDSLKGFDISLSVSEGGLFDVETTPMQKKCATAVLTNRAVTSAVYNK